MISRRPILRVLGVVGAVGLAVLTLHGPAAGAAAGATTTRISLTNADRQANNDSYAPAMSATGRYVAFTSSATNLVRGDTNGRQDVFVRDRLTGRTSRASVTSDERQATSDSVEPSISANGRYVAFSSDASNLVPGDLTGHFDIFVRDLVAGTTRRVSAGPNGEEANGDSYQPAISADGGHVAYTSTATNIVADDTNEHADVFVSSLVEQVTRRVSVGAGGQANADSFGAAISGNGRYVAWSTRATNLVPRDTNGSADVFLRDRQAGTTRRMSVSSAEAQGNGESGLNYVAMSANGRFVVFGSAASNLVRSDTNAAWDVYLRDRIAGTTRRVSLSTAGRQGDGDSGFLFRISMSGDGRYVAYTSRATNLVPGDTNAAFDVFVRDVLAATTQRVSVGADGEQGNASSIDPALSADGRHVAFVSAASNLVPSDTNRSLDVFGRDEFGD